MFKTWAKGGQATKMPPSTFSEVYFSEINLLETPPPWNNPPCTCVKIGTSCPLGFFPPGPSGRGVPKVRKMSRKRTHFQIFFDSSNLFRDFGLLGQKTFSRLFRDFFETLWLSAPETPSPRSTEPQPLYLEQENSLPIVLALCLHLLVVVGTILTARAAIGDNKIT